MKKIISQRFAANAIIIILSAIIVFHILILTGMISFEIVWGGRLESKTQMIYFEMISIFLNILMVTIILIKTKIIKIGIHDKFITIALWAMFALFALNTLGNLVSINNLEKIVFTPLTFLLSLLSLRLVLNSN